MNARQQRFVEEYLVDLNATQAAIRAGYSAKTADVKGSQLLSLVKVKDAVAAGMAKISHHVQVTAEDVVDGLHKEATYMGDGTTHGARVSAWNILGKHTGVGADAPQGNTIVQVVTGLPSNPILNGQDSQG